MNNSNEPLRYPEGLYFNNPNKALSDKYIGEIAIADIPKFIRWLESEQRNGVKRVKIDAMRGGPTNEWPQGEYYAKVNDYKPKENSAVSGGFDDRNSGSDW